MMPSLRARKRIENGQYDPTDYNAVYHLWLTAYGDEEAARKAKAESVKALVDKHCGKMR